MLALTGCSHTTPPRTLTFTGLAGEPDTLNPLVSASADLFSFSHLYMSLLVESDDHGRLIPDIASTVPSRRNGGISSDERTIIYHLRHHVRWQDGAPLNARDIVFSYSAVMNNANNLLTRVGYEEVQSIRARDPYTVVVRLRQPFSPFTAYFFGPQGGPAILPAHLLAKYANLNRVPYNELPVGSGPFTVMKWLHGDRIVLQAYRGYWRGSPWIQRIVYRVIPDPNTRAQALQTHEVDAYFGVDPQLLPLLQRIPGSNITFTAVNDFHVLQFNLHDPIVGDARIRRAIAFAIDRRKLIAVATHGAGIQIEGDQPRNGWAYDPAIPTLPYDPRAAQRLLDEAGWRAVAGGVRRRNGRPLSIGLAIAPQGINGSAMVATTIQRYLAVVGIDVPIKQYAPGLMWAPKPAGGVLSNGRYQMAYNAWWTLGPDPDDSFNFACDQQPPQGENAYFWCNRKADAAMHDALGTEDLRRRARDYRVVEEQLVRDLPELTLWQVRVPDALHVRIRNFSPSPAGSTFWNAWAWQL